MMAIALKVSQVRFLTFSPTHARALTNFQAPFVLKSCLRTGKAPTGQLVVIGMHVHVMFHAAGRAESESHDRFLIRTVIHGRRIFLHRSCFLLGEIPPYKYHKWHAYSSLVRRGLLSPPNGCSIDLCPAMAISKIHLVWLICAALAFSVAAAAVPAQGSGRVRRHYDFFVSVHMIMHFTSVS